MSKFDFIPPGEQAIVQAIVDATIAKQKKEYVPGSLARRDVHSKSHGTVRGRFTVLDNLPASCRVGLFAKPATYDADVRWSNGALGLAPDILPNIRGAGIKIYNVPGAKLLPGEENSLEHDFLLANDRTFFVQRIETMLALSRGEIGAVAKTAPKTLLLLAGAMLKLVKNPLQTSYFSQVPYLLGDRAVKYALIPDRHAPLLAVPRMFDRDYLRHAGEQFLRRQEAGFTFCVQHAFCSDSIEDSTILWRGNLLPVARLTINKIGSVSAIQESDGEALSYNPWRVLAEHEPLGWPGRVRKAVYAADFAWRTSMNLAR